MAGSYRRLGRALRSAMGRRCDLDHSWSRSLCVRRRSPRGSAGDHRSGQAKQHATQHRPGVPRSRSTKLRRRPRRAQLLHMAAWGATAGVRRDARDLLPAQVDAAAGALPAESSDGVGGRGAEAEVAEEQLRPDLGDVAGAGELLLVERLGELGLEHHQARRQDQRQIGLGVEHALHGAVHLPLAVLAPSWCFTSSTSGAPSENSSFGASCSSTRSSGLRAGSLASPSCSRRNRCAHAARSSRL